MRLVLRYNANHSSDYKKRTKHNQQSTPLHHLPSLSIIKQALSQETHESKETFLIKSITLMTPCYDGRKSDEPGIPKGPSTQRPETSINRMNITPAHASYPSLPSRR